MNEIRINNKDIRVLRESLYCKRLADSVAEQRQWENDQKIDISQHITGMPSAKGGVNGLDSTFARIDELQQKHRREVEKYIEATNKTDEILNGISNLNMRAFVRLMYVDQKPYVDIQKELNMSRRGFAKAKFCVETATSMAAVKWPDKYIYAE